MTNFPLNPFEFYFYFFIYSSLFLSYQEFTYPRRAHPVPAAEHRHGLVPLQQATVRHRVYRRHTPYLQVRRSGKTRGGCRRLTQAFPQMGPGGPARRWASTRAGSRARPAPPPPSLHAGGRPFRASLAATKRACGWASGRTEPTCRRRESTCWRSRRSWASMWVGGCAKLACLRTP